MDDLSISHRRADLDWLRVIAFGLLIWFHSAIVFLPTGIPMIQNPESSVALQLFAGFLHEFRLPLLFLISGVGIRFSLKRRSPREFLRDRARRLLLPLAFGVLALVPPMVFLEKRFLGDFSGGFLTFYGQFFTEGTYPRGNLSWHHFWFLAYLFLFCLLGLPIFRYFLGDRGRRRLRDWSERAVRGGNIFLPIVPLVVTETALRAFFPGIPDLIHDWANFVLFFLVLLAGFVLASCEPLLERTIRLRHPALAAGLITTACLFTGFWDPRVSGFTPLQDDQAGVVEYLWFCVLRATNIWCWLIVSLGFAGTWLQRPGRALDYLNGAVYPLFCLHLPVITALAYLIVPLELAVSTKYLLISGGTVVLTLASYELMSRRARWIGPLLGMRPVSGARWSVAMAAGPRARRPVRGPAPVAAPDPPVDGAEPQRDQRHAGDVRGRQ